MTSVKSYFFLMLGITIMVSLLILKHLQIHFENIQIMEKQEDILNRIDQLEQVVKVTHADSMLLHLDPKGFIKKFEIGSYRDRWNKDKFINSDE